MRHRLVALFVLLTVLFLLTEPVYAEGTSNQMIQKLGRGLVNALTGWFELPMQIGSGMSESEGIQGFFLGLGKGVVWTVLREGAGVYETATFLLPFPNDYEPLMQPPTVFK